MQSTTSSITLSTGYNAETKVLNLDVLPVFQLNALFDSLIRFTYDTTTVDTVTYDGKIYRQRDTKWYERDRRCTDLEEYEQDPNIRCNGYMKCEQPDRLEVKPDQITYRLNVDLDNAQLDRYQQDQELALRWYQLWDILFQEETDCQNIRLVTQRKLVLHNTRGDNDDHRGSDHLVLLLPGEYWQVIEVGGLTVADLMQRLYRLKSHKFDYNYEMYVGVKVKSKLEAIVVKLCFDHGS